MGAAERFQVGAVGERDLEGRAVACSCTWRTSTPPFEQALGAGATVTMALEDMFWGDRFGSVTDPFGHVWSLATHTEDLSGEEIAERGRAAMAAMG